MGEPGPPDGAEHGGKRPARRAGHCRASPAGAGAGRRSRRTYRDFLHRFAVWHEEPHLDPEEFDLGFYSYGLRTYGKLPAVLTTIGDVGKSVAAVNLGRFIFDALLSGTGAAWQSPLDPVCGAYLAAIFCMIGHSRPIFFGFKGGKGVLVGAGAALATEPLVCAVLLGIFLIEVAVTRIVSLGSIIIAALYPVGTLINLIARGAAPAYPSFMHDLLRAIMRYAIWLHRSNIERLKNGTEYRFGQKK